jgi:hypothetical protein
MTELMKRYEAETGEKAIDMYTEYATDDFIRWTAVLIDILETRCAELNEENKDLKKQLTWRPVTQKPEESCKCIGKFDDGELYDALVYYDAKNDLWSRLVHDTLVGWYTSYKPPIKYFIIPPAPEEKS